MPACGLGLAGEKERIKKGESSEGSPSCLYRIRVLQRSAWNPFHPAPFLVRRAWDLRFSAEPLKTSAERLHGLVLCRRDVVDCTDVEEEEDEEEEADAARPRTAKPAAAEQRHSAACAKRRSIISILNALPEPPSLRERLCASTGRLNGSSGTQPEGIVPCFLMDLRYHSFALF